MDGNATKKFVCGGDAKAPHFTGCGRPLGGVYSLGRVEIDTTQKVVMSP